MQGGARRGLRWHGSSHRNGPALFNRSSHWQSISSARRLISRHRHSSVPQSEPSAAASLCAGLSRLSSPPRRLAPPRPPCLPLRRNGAWGSAVPPWPCRPGYPAAPGHAPAPSLCPGCARAPGALTSCSVVSPRCHPKRCTWGTGDDRACEGARSHGCQRHCRPGHGLSPDTARPGTQAQQRGARCRLRRAAAEGSPPWREREAGLSVGFSGSAASNLWQLRARLPCQGSVVAPASQGGKRRRLKDRHRARSASGCERAGEGPGTAAAPRPGRTGAAAPRGCSWGPRFAPPQKPRPSHPAAPHRRNEREGGEIIQSRAEKCLNLISVGHGRNRISPMHWNIVSMFPQDG